MLSPLRSAGSRALPHLSATLIQLREISARTKASHYETELVPGHFDNIGTVKRAISEFNEQSYPASVEPKIIGYAPNNPYSRIRYVFASLGQPLKLGLLKTTISLKELEDGTVQARLLDHNR